MTEEFWWGITISIVVALMLFAFIVLLVWKFVIWANKYLDKELLTAQKRKGEIIT